MRYTRSSHVNVQRAYISRTRESRPNRLHASHVRMRHDLHMQYRLQCHGVRGHETASAAEGEVGCTGSIEATPPSVILRGESAWLTLLAAVLPSGMFDGMVEKFGLDIVEQLMRNENIRCPSRVSQYIKLFEGLHRNLRIAAPDLLPSLHCVRER